MNGFESWLRRIQVGLAIAVAALLAGCGSDLNVATVSGKVTLNGEPLPNAKVEFKPASGGRPSFGITDANGVYSLTYNRDAQGAEIGEHTVSITTFNEGDEDSDSPVAASAEKLPPKYNTDSELKKTVESGSNTIDFELESSESVSQSAGSGGSPGADNSC